MQLNLCCLKFYNLINLIHIPFPINLFQCVAHTHIFNFIIETEFCGCVVYTKFQKPDDISFYTCSIIYDLNLIA